MYYDDDVVNGDVADEDDGACIDVDIVDDEDECGGDVGDDANVHEDGVDDVDAAHHHINISMYIIIEIRIIINIIISNIIITDRFRSK